MNATKLSILFAAALPLSLPTTSLADLCAHHSGKLRSRDVCRTSETVTVVVSLTSTAPGIDPGDGFSFAPIGGTDFGFECDPSTYPAIP